MHYVTSPSKAPQISTSTHLLMGGKSAIVPKGQRLY